MNSSPSIQEFLDKGANISFEEHIRPAVAAGFKALLTGTLRVVANLLPEQKRAVVDMFPCPIVFATPAKATLQPHPVLAAVRGAVRNVVHADLCVQAKVSTLFVGSTYRDIANGITNPAWSFSVYGAEPKDSQRLVPSMLDDISSYLTDTAKYYDVSNEDLDFEMTQDEVLKFYGKLHGLEDRLGYRLEDTGRKYERLVYYDSAYNLEWSDFADHFKTTGANSALVLGIYPVELVEENCPEDPNYRLEIVRRMGTEYARLVDRKDGFANGYEHRLDKWASIMRSPAYESRYGFNLVSEIRSRVGPYCVFEISRTVEGGCITRDIVLFKEPYVKVLDIVGLASSEKLWKDTLVTGVARPTDYFLMKEEEYNQVYDYVASLDRKAVDLEVVSAHVRRRSGGAALIDRSFTKAWQLDHQLHHRMVASVIVKVELDKLVLDSAMEEARNVSASYVKRLLSSVVSFVSHPVGLIVDLFRSSNAANLIVLRHNPVLSQTVMLKSKIPVGNTHKFRLNLKDNSGFRVPEAGMKCEICDMFPWLDEGDASDAQHWICPGGNKAVVDHTFRMTTDEVEKFRTDYLTPCDEDPVGVAAVKAAAKRACPKTGFSFTTKVSTIQGPPGSGKSFQIRKVVSNKDAVLAPFRKLMADYTEDKNGDKIFFKTMHRAIGDMESRDVFYVDEFGSLPYEFLAVSAYLGQPDLLFLVGDLKQTAVMASEGTRIDLRIDCKRPHTMVKNFRNTTGTIEWMVNHFGYVMQPGEKNVDGPCWEFGSPREGVLRVSPDRVTVDIEEADHTGREMQGSTEDDIDLMISPASMKTFAVAAVRLVCLTRTRNPTRICLTEDADKNEVLALLARVEHPKRRQDKPCKVDKASIRADKGMVALSEFLKTHEANMLARSALEASFLKAGGVDPNVKTLKELHATEYEPDYKVQPKEEKPVVKKQRRSTRKVDLRAGFFLNLEMEKPLPVPEEYKALSRENKQFETTMKAHRASMVLIESKVVVRNLKTFSVPVSDISGVVDENLPKIYVYDGSKMAGIKAKEDVAGWRELSTLFASEVSTVKRSGIQALSVKEAAPSFRSAKDALTAVQYQDNHAFNEGQSLNQITRMPGTVFTGKIKGDFTDIRNSKGNLKKMASVFRFGTGNALHYDSGHPTQELHTAAARYALPQKAFVEDEAGRRLAMKIAEEAFNAAIDKEKLVEAWNSMDASAVLDEWMNKAKAAGYASAHTLDSENDMFTIRFHPKAQAKVKEEAIRLEGLFKAPQGISATSKEFNTLAGAVCRFVSVIICMSLKEHIVWNNNCTTEEAGRKYTAAANKVPTTTNITMDVVEMDSKQNWFTHLVNRCLDELLGVSKDFLDFYYSQYKSYDLVGSMFTSKQEGTKPSGAPWTLKGNSWLEFMIQNYIIRGDGPLAVFFQGDDLNRTQANMVVDIDRRSQIERYCAFEMTMQTSDEAAFCGYVYANGMLIPNIRRKLNKVMCANIRNKAHFFEYQKGLRDWVVKLRSDANFGDFLLANAKQLGGDQGQVEAWLESIDSISHCSWDQWVSLAHKVTLNINYLNEARELTSVW